MFAKMKTGTRLAVGFALLLVLMIGMGWMALNGAATLRAQTSNLYEHPFRVTRALLESKVQVETIVGLVDDGRQLSRGPESAPGDRGPGQDPR